MRQDSSTNWSQDAYNEPATQAMSYSGGGTVIADNFQQSSGLQQQQQTQQQQQQPHVPYPHPTAQYSHTTQSQPFMFGSNASNSLYTTDSQAKNRRVSSPSVGQDPAPPLYTQANAYANVLPNQQSNNFYSSAPSASSSVYDRRQSHPVLPTYHNGQKAEGSIMTDAYNNASYDMSAYSTDPALSNGTSYQRASYDASSLYPSAGTSTYNAFASPSTDYTAQQNNLTRSLPTVMMPNGIIAGDQATGVADPLSATSYTSGSSLKGSAPSAMMTTFNSKAVSSSQKKHRCSICNKRFTRPSSLQTHIYSHTGEKPFKCEYEGCGRQFSVVSNLRRHKKIHTSGGGSS